MPRSARPDDLYRLRRPHRPPAVPGRPHRRLHRQAQRRRPRRLPPGHLARPGRRERRCPPTHGGRADGPPSPVLAGRPDARLHLRPPRAGRGGAGASQGPEGPRRLRPGPPAAARRRRGPPAHGPPAGRGDVRLVARRDPARRPDQLARRDHRRGPPQARPPGEAEARRDPAVGLPLHRPPRLPVQRRGVRRRPRDAPVARRRRDGRGQCAGLRSLRRVRPGLVARRDADRVRREPPPGPGPRRGASGIFIVDVDSGEVTTIAGGADATVHRPRPGPATAPAILALGDRFPRSGYRTGIWRFAADGSDAGPARRHGPPGALASSSPTPR